MYLGADAWLTRDEELANTRRSGHAAAAGSPMPTARNDGAAARGEAITAGS